VTSGLDLLNFAHAHKNEVSVTTHLYLRITDVTLNFDNYLSTVAVFLDIENSLIPPGLNYKILKSNFSFSTVKPVQLTMPK